MKAFVVQCESVSPDAMLRQRESHRIVDDIMTRRDAGEYIPDESIIASYPVLMPELAEELAVLRHLQLAEIAANKAGPVVPSPAQALDLTGASNATSSGIGQNVQSRSSRPVIVGYPIIEEISRGGQASVYSAVQVSTGRRVAIKVMHGGNFATARLRKRFERETRILASLSHPNIVSVLDAGQTADGSFFLAMPFIDGCCLDYYLVLHKGRHPDAIRRKLLIFVKIAEAVGEAHRHDIVHRDLKPSNILVDHRGDPFVLDFGLAQVLESQSLRRVDTVTLPGQLVGSVPWFSPEQASGLPLDQRSDVYALGVMLYKSINEAFPYPVEGAMRDVLNHIVTTPPPPLDEESAKDYFTLGLDRVVRKALSKSAAARHSNATGLAEDLRQLLATPRPASIEPIDNRVPRRSRRRDALLVSCVLTVATVGGMRHFRRPPPSPLPPAATKPPVVVVDPGFTNSAGTVFSRFPAGTFLMGSAADEPGHMDDEEQHPVTISKGFWISRLAVTTRQYKAVFHKAPAHAWTQPDDQPAAPVSWEDANNYCKVLSEQEHRSYRLPREAEWEYVCRLVYRSPNDPVVMPTGNWEWCFDWYGPYKPGPTTDPTGVQRYMQRICRGGRPSEFEAEFRPAHRNARNPSNSYRPPVGFRIVLESESPKPPLNPS